MHTESDLRVFLRWCSHHGLDPLSAARVDIERHVRWLQDVRRYQPSTVSRRLSVVVGFYRVCVIDAILEHSPADYVRRPTVPAESPTLGLGHLQFEALIAAARLSANPNDFAPVALLGLLGLRIFEACGSSIADLGEEHGHRVLRVRGKGGKVALVPLPPAVARANDRAVNERTAGPLLRNTNGRRMDRHAATRRLKHLTRIAGIRMPRMHPHMLRHTFVTTMLDAGVSLRDVQIAARHADPRTTMRYDRARKNLDRHPTTSSPPTWPPGRSQRSRLCRFHCSARAQPTGRLMNRTPCGYAAGHVDKRGPGVRCGGSTHRRRRVHRRGAS
ncbi:tyrosine-type recombinase/integrase [Micromonospora chalcea]|uniref:tyrosine-type recombinase/integrase n=1 Tax=Micromonospora chalcea TaxID=1874 RepID=UPI00378881D6